MVVCVFWLVALFLDCDSGVWICCASVIVVACSLRWGLFGFIDCGVVLDFGFAGLIWVGICAEISGLVVCGCLCLGGCL